MNYGSIIREIEEELKTLHDEGNVARYIPELAKVDPEKFGICIQCLDGKTFYCGDYQEGFSVQSIAKVFSLSMAILLEGDELWKRVGVEPSGDPFNSLVQLEYEKGIPRNPFINAGALVISDVLVSHFTEPKREFLTFVREITGLPYLDFDQSVAQSEHATGFRNRAMANFLCSFGNLENDVDKVLDFYFHMCSLVMTCEALAKAFVLFANHGTVLHSAAQVLNRSQSQRLSAIMQTCGFYDEAGEFAFKVGLPPIIRAIIVSPCGAPD